MVRKGLIYRQYRPVLLVTFQPHCTRRIRARIPRGFISQSCLCRLSSSLQARRSRRNSAGTLTSRRSSRHHLDYDALVLAFQHGHQCQPGAEYSIVRNRDRGAVLHSWKRPHRSPGISSDDLRSRRIRCQRRRLSDRSKSWIRLRGTDLVDSTYRSPLTSPDSRLRPS